MANRTKCSSGSLLSKASTPVKYCEMVKFPKCRQNSYPRAFGEISLCLSKVPCDVAVLLDVASLKLLCLHLDSELLRHQPSNMLYLPKTS